MAEIVTGLAGGLGEVTRPDCAVIGLTGVTREYAGHGGVVRALDQATFSIVAGEWVAITGPSGSGKSTLVNLLGCLDRPTEGELKIDGVDVSTMSASELDRFPRGQDRLYLSAVPPDSLSIGFRKCDAGAILPFDDG